MMVQVQNAYSKGGIPLEMHAVANVKVTSDPVLVGNAIERLFTMSGRQIASIAQQQRIFFNSSLAMKKITCPQKSHTSSTLAVPVSTSRRLAQLRSSLSPWPARVF
jgi:hypothetical protein